MHTLPKATEHPSPIPKRTKRTGYQRMGNDPLFDLRSELYRIAGVDLTDIPGVSAIAAQVVLTEVGPDVSRFRNASAFASWLGLCPDKRISGGKVLSTKTRKVKNRSHRAPARCQIALPCQGLLRRVFPQNASQAWHCAGHDSNGA
jgi:transposase